MALNKVEKTEIGKFGSLTSSAKAKTDASIFGKNACHTVCSYDTSFASFGDTFNCSTKEGKEQINKEIAIMTGQDKKDNKPAPKKFEMNQKSLQMLQKELGLDMPKKNVSLCS